MNKLPDDLGLAIAEYVKIRLRRDRLEAQQRELKRTEEEFNRDKQKILSSLMEAFDKYALQHAAIRIGSSVYRRPKSIYDDSGVIIESVIEVITSAPALSDRSLEAP